jgi:hypothetical protein
MNTKRGKGKRQRLKREKKIRQTTADGKLAPGLEWVPSEVLAQRLAEQ